MTLAKQRAAIAMIPGKIGPKKKPTSMLAESRQLLRTAFQQWSGHEVDIQGDAFLQADFR
jgi:hypothetical protein